MTVPVTVSDASAPVFAFQNSKDSTIKVGESFNQNDYKVVGSWAIFNNYSGDYSKLPNFEGIAKNSDGTPQVTVSGNVDTNTPGIYQLTYKAVSTSGAVTTMVRNVTVLPKESTTDWTMNDMKAVGYINYTPGYGIMVYTAPATGAKGQRLAHGTSWKISQKAVNANGDTFYKVGTNQWINGKYVTFSPINTITPLKGEVKIVYKKGYGVNLWKSAGTTGGFYTGRKLKHGTSWKTSGKQNGFYKVGKDQWIQGDYASYKSY
ncbi:immunoglobulin-like domain-containing protein [Xylocopilactobacillus apis]|uniref:immunoglobulin-like domain-containing protein n=1 Tax=Xylocopilactobacillus apis TaxID=2932183 RepID=UPI002952EFE2|nr:immunoglobulin-like domain-containing protein [Xylocopilactobacillus apis]